MMRDKSGTRSLANRRLVRYIIPYVFISRTVLLESEWVLRSVYGFAGKEVAAALRAFAGLPRVSVERTVSSYE